MSNDLDFQFVDAPPPQSRGRNALYEAFRNALKDRPGEWAIYPRECKNPTAANVCAGNIRSGRNASAFTAGDYEARSAGTTVYVRYVGGAL